MSALDLFAPATRTWFEGSFAAPTPVQEAAWPHIHAGDHTLLVAPTGSGKTLAAFLAALDHVSQRPDATPPGVRVLYISPLKALVYDIERNLRAPLAGIARTAALHDLQVAPIRVDVRTGDTPQRERRRQSTAPAEILVTTPESLYLLLTSPNGREALRTVQTVILDEIHVLAGTKRGVHLALSLERLTALCDADPQRVGLSATQRPLEVAARFLGGDRPVQIVDTSGPPHMALQIVVPVADMERPPQPVVAPPASEADPWDFGDRPPTLLPPVTGSSSPLQGGIWPSIHPRLLALVRAHRSTIIFVNSRLLCERLAQALNEIAGEELVRAHHGSISHAQRTVTEEALKAGQIPALVATSSLELGIDMGAVDLVVLVASPGSAARGLQRIGRAGHQVGALSQGRIFPKFRGDLLESAVVAQQMVQGHIEATATPRNCLDVLSQQVVAMVAGDDWTVDALWALVRRAAPFATLSREALVRVLDMLSGRYPSDAFADLTPSLTWDRSTDVLSARRGARLLAVLNAGTIPDRGLYRVHLGSDGPRLGEFDEEMVFESRQGDHIILGASTWRVDRITRDRVEVSPAPGQPGRLPFWRGERPGRPIELGQALGAFLRQVAQLDRPAMQAWFEAHAPLDALAAGNLTAYVSEQLEATGCLPTDQAITVERFRDELGDWRVCVLTPFGSRVHAPWALAIEALLQARSGFDVQVFHSDDGIAIRFADVEELPALSTWMPEPEDLEDLIVEQLQHSALFATRFRENAGRALLLPRRRGQDRTPLWLQRRRSAALLAAAQQHPSFPIVLETYRECLQDVFDLPALTDVLTRIRSRAIRVDEVDTRQASPFARSLVFQYIAAYLYDGDSPLAERKAAALTLDRNLLRELLGQEELRDLLDGEAVAEVEAELQCLAPGRHARHADALHDLLRRLGDLDEAAIAARCTEDPSAWIAQLHAARQILSVRIAGEARWIAVEDAARYRDALGVVLPAGLPSVWLEVATDPLQSLLRRYARTHGPFHPEDIAHRYGLTVPNVVSWLRPMEQAGHLVHGELLPGGHTREWCDAEVLRRLRRRSLARLRDEVAPVEREVLARFLPRWQGVGAGRGGIARLREVIAQLEGLPIPASVLEQEVLPARVNDYQPLYLDQLGAMGEVVWIGRGALGTRDGHVALYLRARAPLLLDAPVVPEGLSPLGHTLLTRLNTRGACFLTELQAAAPEASTADLLHALWDLVWAGLVTNDTFQPLRGLQGAQGRTADRLTRIAGGRWSAVTSLLGPTDADPTERAHTRITTLLERYGVVSREATTTESWPGGFTGIYPALRIMEEAGRVRRGWFVDGLSGAQFAHPGAVDRLRAHRLDEPGELVLAASDPAQIWGGLVPWPATVTEASRPRRAAGCLVVLVDGRPACWLGKGARRMVLFAESVADAEVLGRMVQALRAHVGFRSLHIDMVDQHDALSHPALAQLVAAGFERDFKGLTLTRRA